MGDSTTDQMTTDLSIVTCAAIAQFLAALWTLAHVGKAYGFFSA